MRGALNNRHTQLAGYYFPLRFLPSSTISRTQDKTRAAKIKNSSVKSVGGETALGLKTRIASSSQPVAVPIATSTTAKKRPHPFYLPRRRTKFEPNSRFEYLA